MRSPRTAIVTYAVVSAATFGLFFAGVVGFVALVALTWLGCALLALEIVLGIVRTLSRQDSSPDGFSVARSSRHLRNADDTRTSPRAAIAVYAVACAVTFALFFAGVVGPVALVALTWLGPAILALEIVIRVARTLSRQGRSAS